MFIAITSRSCNGPAVRIKLSKPWGKIWLKTKTKTKNIYSKEKQLSQGSNIFHLHGRMSSPRPLRHTDKNKVKWKIIIQSIIFVKFCQQTLFEAGGAVFIMNSKTNLRKISYN